MAESSDQIALVVDDLHVVYRVYEERHPRLKDLILGGFQARAYREIHAVRGVSFTVKSGDALGVIGPNGSGKSTLLRALAGLQPATQGGVYARYRPSLLGVGAVLNSSLSGRRNVMLGGLALGLTRREVNDRFDEIVEFAGLEDFIDLPMRTYSSGMKARLHFSIATAVAPEVLLIDEALAVGDKEFRKRSSERLREIRERAGTIVLVSHNLGEIRDSCTQAIWLDKGRMVASGDPAEVVAAYEK